MTIHIQNTASELIDSWKKNGFNGVRFSECYLEPSLLSDFLGDGRTEQEYSQC